MRKCPVCDRGYLYLMRRIQVLVKGSKTIRKVNIYNCSNQNCLLNSKEEERIKYSDFLFIDELNFELPKESHTGNSED